MNGRATPHQLNATPRTIFEDNRTKHYYDQIAWFSETNKNGELHDILQGLSFNRGAGYVDFLPHFFNGATKEAVS